MTYTIALVCSPDNKKAWKRLKKHLTASTEDSKVVLVEFTGKKKLKKRLYNLGPQLVVIDFDLKGARSAARKVLLSSKILLLLQADLTTEQIAEVIAAFIKDGDLPDWIEDRSDEIILSRPESAATGAVRYSPPRDDDEQVRRALETLAEKGEFEDDGNVRARGVRQSALQLQNPQFTAFYPRAVAPSKSYALMAFAHIESAWEQVQQEAQRFKEIMGGQQSSETADSKIEVAAGTLLTFVPLIDGIAFTPAEQVITWNGQPYYSATFLFQTPADLSADLSGRVQVYNGPLIIGEIPVMMAFAQDAAGVNSAQMKKFEPIFASYSHDDSPVMEYFRRTRKKLGQKMLVDVYDLRSGEHWAQRLLEMIDESAVFQLFWSQHSAESQYCRQEWEYALKFVPQRERFIQPVWWEEPMPKPPPELSAFHFQKIKLPVSTRVQARIRRSTRR